MKRIVIFSLIALMLLPCKAQQSNPSKHEMSVSAGFLPSTDSRMFLDILIAAITLGLVVPDDMASYGSYSLEYTYHQSDKLAYGLFAGYSANKTIYKSGYDDVNYKRENFRNYYYCMPTLKITWSHKSHVNFYSYAGVGTYYRYETTMPLDDSGAEKSSDDQLMVAFQLTPIGAEFGGERFKFFTELGVGNKGFLSAGFRFKL